MRLWVKVLIIILIAVATLFISAYIFIMVNGKAIIIKKLMNLTHKEVSIETFKVSLPFDLVLQNLEIKGMAKLGRVTISPRLPFPLAGYIVLNKVIIENPEFVYQRNPPEEVKSAIKSASFPAAKKAKPPRVIFRSLIIKDGTLNFSDHTVRPAGIRIAVKDLNVNVHNLYVFPFSTITNFDLKGRIPWRQGKEDGKISLEGWINFFKKDIQAALRVDSIDGTYLYPYYSNWVDLDKARIESANLAFTSNINGLNNNVTADCHLELTDIVRKPLEPGSSEQKAAKVTDAVLDMLRTLDEGKIVLDFTIKTKMDKPQFGFGSIKTAFENKLAKARSGNGIQPQDIALLPIKLFEGTVRGMTDFSKALIDGTFAIANELKKSFQETFSKTPKAAEEIKE